VSRPARKTHLICAQGLKSILSLYSCATNAQCSGTVIEGQFCSPDVFLALSSFEKPGVVN